MNTSDYFGNLSQLFWLIAQIPQILKNYKTKSIEGLSFYFLLNWILGDLSNLIGCLLTNQLKFQRNLAIYFISIDLILILQFLIYKNKNNSTTTNITSNITTINSSSSSNLTSNHQPTSNLHSKSISNSNSITNLKPNLNRSTAPLTLLSLFTFFKFNLIYKNHNILHHHLNSQFVSQAWIDSSLNNAPDSSFNSSNSFNSNWKIILGRTSAWSCCLLYLTSRLPQIWKNYRRQSVQGLSILLFVMAFFGNLTYLISILTSPLIKSNPNHLINLIPYLLGSGGTLSFDLIIFIQSQIYRHNLYQNQNHPLHHHHPSHPHIISNNILNHSDESSPLIHSNHQFRSNPHSNSFNKKLDRIHV
ncbi:hypothetical protein O181_067527 [Austropuccinia psidii MF-1]|uniref:Uncharacterized protein n=1 Tax=Austropuccinia psidii MF-1 TaxID=1389203 RepID=A0A9Q3EXJ4_9BASI|nr:hypothetical protein [Austropuccinia psidii MF-1]